MEATLKQSSLTAFLAKSSNTIFSIYAIGAAFTTYFCMYAFRKPFSVGLFEGTVELPLIGEIGYKILLIVAQVFGYTLSKFMGIKVISEMPSSKRAIGLIFMIVWAEASLFLFAITPKPWNFIFLFLNGVPLGMVWGLFFGFLEGRRFSELLGAGLSASYIVASGAVKSVGKTVMDNGVSENYMPFVTGLIFFPLFLLCVYLLKQLPPPTKEDEELRTKRAPMGSEDRWAFLKAYAPGLFFLTGLYMFLTAYRDFRDNFAREIWDALGYKSSPEIFTTAEIPIAFGVLIALALIMLVKDNTKAMKTIHLVMIFGTILIGVSTFLYQSGLLAPAYWMISVGLGLYLGYVPFGCVLFDRLIAAVGFMGTAGFMIYVTDAFGYLGSVGLMLYKNFGQPDLSWLDFFIGFSYFTSVLCTVCFIFSMGYFTKQTKIKYSEK